MSHKEREPRRGQHGEREAYDPIVLHARREEGQARGGGPRGGGRGSREGGGGENRRKGTRIFLHPARCAAQESGTEQAGGD